MSVACRVSAKGGQLAKKSLRGLTRRCRRQSARRDPRPPWCRISCVKMPFYSRKPTPFDLCCIALWLSRSSSTACRGRSSVACRGGRVAARGASKGRCTALARGAGRRARARTVIVYNPGAVTHLIPYYVTRVFACTRTLTRHPHARTHSAARPTVTPLVHSPSRTHIQARTLFFAHRFFFIAIVSRNAIFTHVSPTLTNLILCQSTQ